MITTIITFVIVFGILVFVHELGHFLAAKKSGILVREFSIGMGPKIFAANIRDTTFTIRILPIGGYVRMAGLDDGDDEIKPGQHITLITDENNVVTTIDTSNNGENEGIPFDVSKCDLLDDLFIEGYENGDESELKRFKVDPKAFLIEQNGTAVRIAPRNVQFQSASVLHRFMTNFAGPFNNFILAILVFSLLGILAGEVPSNSNQVRVLDNGIAKQAGIKNNDRIVEINSNKVNNWSDIQKGISNNPNKKLRVTVKHNGKNETLSITPKAVKQGTKYTGVIGITSTMTNNFSSRILFGFTQTWSLTKELFASLGQMLTHFSLNDLGGPVAIYATTSKASSQGFMSVLTVLGFLSLNLGIVNLLPIPALDGGKLLLNIIEAVRRKPISQKTEVVINMIGVVFLLILMFLVTFNDIQRYF